MATATKKPTIDPVVEELPPHPDPRPERAADVTFEIEISPYVVQGNVFFRWEIVNHSHKAHIATYVGQSQAGHTSKAAAEKDAATFVERIRHTVNLKLSAPEAYTITL